MGPDGHVASLFPGSEGLHADPGRLVVMNEDPTGVNPHPRMTLTLAGIARARLVLVTVSGDSKREALARVVAGDESCPGTHVNADRVLWIADRAAAG
jgi:6-phosphogluconolactonase